MKRIDRRAFLISLASTGALAGCGGHASRLLPGFGASNDLSADAASPTTLQLINNSGYPNNQVFFYVWGHDTASNTFQYLLPNGTTKKWTPAVGNDFGIAFGQTASVKLPKLVAAEIYVSLGTAKPSFLNGQPNQVEPVAPNAWNPDAFGKNFDKLFDHIEYTYINSTLGVNTTTVDMLSLPFTVVMAAGAKSTKFGFDSSKKMSALYKEFAAEPTFKNLLVKGSKAGTFLRVIAPGHGIENAQKKLTNQFPPDYLAAYIDECWKFYTSNELKVYTDDGKTLLATGRVNENGLFVFTTPKDLRLTWKDAAGKQWTGFPKPSTLGALECAADEIPSPSIGGEPPTSIINSFGACGKNLGASINRTVLRQSVKQPHCRTADFYKEARTNKYSKILHEYSIGGNCYGFAYDDLCGYSNYVAMDNVSKLQLIVGSLA